MSRRFSQVDVFTSTPCLGNPVAVVHDADGLDDDAMRRFARWTNLSETTFLLAPTEPDADYRVRIFTPDVELPFAGHPTLGSCHAWLDAGGVPTQPGRVVQQCAAGSIVVRAEGSSLAFAAPPLVRSGEVADTDLDDVVRVLGIGRDDVVAASWADNGPGWVALLLRDVDTVAGLSPIASDWKIGVVAPRPPGDDAAFEVRAFFPKRGLPDEDPVTGSLNASIAQWLLGSGLATAPYVASQGTALGRAGRVHVSTDDDGTIWIGGGTITCVHGEVDLG